MRQIQNETRKTNPFVNNTRHLSIIEEEEQGSAPSSQTFNSVLENQKYRAKSTESHMLKGSLYESSRFTSADFRASRDRDTLLGRDKNSMDRLVLTAKKSELQKANSQVE